MERHPKAIKVNQANLKISQVVCDVADEYDLTALEIIGILLEIAQTHKKYALREERHPNDPDKPADWA